MAASGGKGPTRFSSTMCRDSGEDFDLICQPCDKDDIRLPAFGFCRDCQEHMCESCFNHHKRATPSRHHILLDKQNMPQTQQLSASAHSGQSDDLTSTCPKHTKEMTMFHCHDHRALLCSVCVNMEHTTTGCRINYIPDISEQSIDSKDYIDILQNIDVLIKKCQQITTDLKQMTAKSNTSLTEVLAEIKKFRQEINQRLDELEEAAEVTIKTVHLENDTILQKGETACNDAIKALKTSSDTIKQLNRTKQADRLFMEMKLAEQTVQDNKEKIYRLTSPDDFKEFHFQPNSAITTCLKNEKSTGTLIQKTRNLSSRSLDASALKFLKFSHHGVMNVKASQDQRRCWITGMAFLMPSKLILTDKDNSSIKMFDINSNSIIDQLKLDTNPWDITTVTRDQVAATLTDAKTIQFISVSSNKLSLKNKLKVHGFCQGITCYEEKLALTSMFPTKLEIIDLKGKVLTTVTTDLRNNDIFTKPCHVTSTSSAIYVADYQCKVLNWRGEVTGSYGGVQLPQAITVLEDGSVFVTDCSQNNMHHVSGDLTKGKVVLKDLRLPHAVCVCGTKGLLYISSVANNDIDGNFIQIFKMIE